MKTPVIQIVAACVLLSAASVALPKNPERRANALLLNGQEISTEQLTRVTRGIISMGTAGAPVPFLIYTRRSGKIVDAEADAHNHPVTYYEISEILKTAKAGDEIVIDPVGNTNAAGRKVIIVNGTQVIPQFQWFNMPKLKKDNC